MKNYLFIHFLTKSLNGLVGKYKFYLKKHFFTNLLTHRNIISIASHIFELLFFSLCAAFICSSWWLDSFSSISFHLLFAQPCCDKIRFYFTWIFVCWNLFSCTTKTIKRSAKKIVWKKIQDSNHREKMKILSNILLLIDNRFLIPTRLEKAWQK